MNLSLYSASHSKASLGVPAYTGISTRSKAYPALQCRAASDQGDLNVQGRLVDILQLQITQERVKQLAAEEGQKLIDNAEQLRAEIDKLQQLSTSRNDAAFDDVLADFNKRADELADVLKQTRAEQEAKNQEFKEWEQSMAIQRSKGLFFKSLHRLKNQQGASTSKTQEADRLLRQISSGSSMQQSQPEQEYPLLTLTYGALAVILACAAVADATQPDAMLWRDALYLTLAIVLGGAYASKRLL